MPFKTSDCIALIVYMANIWKLKAAMITNYFSGFGMLHLIKGHYKQQLRADVVTQMKKGIKNGDHIREMIQNKQPRQPVTVEGIHPQHKNANTPQEADIVHSNNLSPRIFWYP
jgi:hypothetical protein